MARIVIAEFMDADAVARLAATHAVFHDAVLVDDPPRLLAEAADCAALIVRNRTQVRGPLLAALAAGRCRVVGRLGVGLDNIDVDGCAGAGIRVIPATGANARAVAEYVIASAMLLLRGAYGATGAVAAGQWPRLPLSGGREIGGKVLGLVGFGSIGRLTANLARAVGMTVQACDAQLADDDPVFAEAGVRPVGLDALVASSDVVSLHLPLVASTRGLFDARRLAAMKPDAVLINSARGGIVDEQALAAALRAGRLGGAAIDVFATEPLAAAAHFVDCPRLLLTPHVAGLSAEANTRVGSLVADKVLEALA